VRSLLGARSAIRRFARAHPALPALDVVTGTISDADVDALHVAGDCYVGLGCGEGWSIPAFDAAAFGNAVVATRFGGPLEYLSPQSAYLVDCTLVPDEDRMAASSYASTQRWARPSIDAAARFMRAVYEHPAEARSRGEVLARDVRRRFAERAVAPTLLEALSS
jgi:glycosyltransferase involved in cell wall biosynthesis